MYVFFLENSELNRKPERKKSRHKNVQRAKVPKPKPAPPPLARHRKKNDPFKSAFANAHRQLAPVHRSAPVVDASAESSDRQLTDRADARRTFPHQPWSPEECSLTEARCCTSRITWRVSRPPVSIRRTHASFLCPRTEGP